jgi:hypothetical protein
MSRTRFDRLPKKLNSGIWVGVQGGAPYFWWEGPGPEPIEVAWLNQDVPCFKTQREAKQWLHDFLHGAAQADGSYPEVYNAANC